MLRAMKITSAKAFSTYASMVLSMGYEGPLMTRPQANDMFIVVRGRSKKVEVYDEKDFHKWFSWVGDVKDAQFTPIEELDVDEDA